MLSRYILEYEQVKGKVIRACPNTQQYVVQCSAFDFQR